MSALPRPCIVCGALIPSGTRCIAHERKWAPNPTRPSPYSRGYDRTYRAMRERVLARDDHVCARCGGRADTVDHIVPVSKGGGHDPMNLRAMCRRCNSSRRDRG